MVSNEEVVVVVTFMDGAGNVLYSQSFSSKRRVTADHRGAALRRPIFLSPAAIAA